MELLNEKDIPYGFKYPETLKKIAVLGLVNLCPWWILDKERTKRLIPIIQRSYPKRKLIPFAIRQDNDDTACFEIGKEENVQIIHLGATDGWEQCETYKDCLEWLKNVLEDLRDVDLNDCIMGLNQWR